MLNKELLSILRGFMVHCGCCIRCVVLLWLFNIYATTSLQCTSDSLSVYSALKVHCSSYLLQSNSSGLRANARLHTQIWHNKANSLFITDLAIIVIPLFSHCITCNNALLPQCCSKPQRDRQECPIWHKECSCNQSVERQILCRKVHISFHSILILF